MIRIGQKMDSTNRTGREALHLLVGLEFTFGLGETGKGRNGGCEIRARDYGEPAAVYIRGFNWATKVLQEIN